MNGLKPEKLKGTLADVQDGPLTGANAEVVGVGVGKRNDHRNEVETSSQVVAEFREEFYVEGMASLGHGKDIKRAIDDIASPILKEISHEIRVYWLIDVWENDRNRFVLQKPLVWEFEYFLTGSRSILDQTAFLLQ